MDFLITIALPGLTLALALTLWGVLLPAWAAVAFVNRMEQGSRADRRARAIVDGYTLRVLSKSVDHLVERTGRVEAKLMDTFPKGEEI